MAVPPSQVDHSQSLTHGPCAYTEPNLGGALTAYGPQAVIHPPLLMMTPGRIPLPLDPTERPIYVNAKQYHRILKRRHERAKLGLQNKLVKGHKTYLHESRHQHAMNRVRGPGGRFLNTKLQQPNPPSTADGQNVSSSSHQLPEHSHVKAEAQQSESSNVGASATCSEITSISNDDDMFEQTDLGFTSAGGNLQGKEGETMCNGPLHWF